MVMLDMAAKVTLVGDMGKGYEEGAHPMPLFLYNKNAHFLYPARKKIYGKDKSHMTRKDVERLSDQLNKLNELNEESPKPSDYDVFEENRYVVVTLEFSPDEDRKRIKEYAMRMDALFKLLVK